MTPKGLLLVLSDPPPELEGEFNDWYDTEHIPERAAVPGFETALRYAAVSGGPAYAALYDLASVYVLETAAYRAVSGEHFSPWTRRVTSRSRPVRTVWRQLDSDGAATAACSRLLLVTVADALPLDAEDFSDGLRASFGSTDGHFRSRIFESVDPRCDQLLAVVELSSHVVPPLLPEAIGSSTRRVGLAGLYRPWCA